MIFDKPIIIQKLDTETERWNDLYRLHAHINKNTSKEYLNAGAERSSVTKTFVVRYFKNLQEIELNTTIYRIIYNNHAYNIIDYDDFQEQHQIIKFTGVAT